MGGFAEKPDVLIERGTFPSADGIHALSYALYRPEREPKAILMVVHGLRDHMGRYDDFARWIAGQGIAVALYDQLGHGSSALSDAELGHFGEAGGDKFLVSDLRTLCDIVHERMPKKRIFVLGQGMGSDVVRLYLIEHTKTIRGAICIGAGGPSGLKGGANLRAATAAVKKGGANSRSEALHQKLYGHYNKRIRNAKTTLDWLSRDEAAVAAQAADPKCTFLPTAAALRDAALLSQRVGSSGWIKSVPKDMPLYFLSGVQDPAGQYGAGVQKLINQLRAEGVVDITVKLYDDARHDLIHEKKSADVWDAVARWVVRNASGTRTGF